MPKKLKIRSELDFNLKRKRRFMKESINSTSAACKYDVGVKKTMNIVKGK